MFPPWTRPQFVGSLPCQLLGKPELPVGQRVSTASLVARCTTAFIDWGRGERSATTARYLPVRSPLFCTSRRPPQRNAPGALERLHRLFETFPSEDAQHQPECNSCNPPSTVSKCSVSYETSCHNNGGCWDQPRGLAMLHYRESSRRAHLIMYSQAAVRSRTRWKAVLRRDLTWNRGSGESCLPQHTPPCKWMTATVPGSPKVSGNVHNQSVC